jgi:heme/copper-type cytochrome/quinol oxidase subunit 3
MIRPILSEIAIFIAPFAAYAIYLFVTKSGVLARSSWPPKVLASLAIVAMILMFGSFVIMAQFSGEPPGGTYEPARIEDGKFVPGRVVR